MSNRGAYAQEKARIYLTKVIEQHRAGRQCRLPGVRVLAHEADVSVATMNKVISALESEQYITAIPGGGLYVTSLYIGKKQTKARSRQKPKWQIFVSDFKNALRKGTYVAGTALPSIKTLEQQHGMCYRTLRKALDELVKDGIIVPYKKTFRVPSVQVTYGSAVVVLVAKGSSGGVFSLVTPRTQENLRTLETECSRLKLQLIKVPCDEYGRFIQRYTSVMGMISEQKKTKTVIGFMVWAIGIEKSGVRNIEKQLGAFGVPIAFLDEKAMLDENALLYRHSTRFSMASSYVSGILVGNYLLQYGHVNIAYISPLHEPQWSKNRLIGLQDAFAANAGVIHNVVPMVLDLPPLHVENKSSDRYIDAFLQKIKRQKETKPCLIRALEESRNRLRDAMQREHLLLRLRPLFQKVMQDSSVSVWVAGNDMIALALWELCNERKVNVPEDISLIGFDDSVEAHVWGLTSYNFNATAVMRAMLMFLLYSSLQCTEKNEEKFREIEGFIVERRSIKKTT